MDNKDSKRDLTSELIAESLKELTQTMPFEKITIRMITERAGVIRPTFYYHFQDKYETLEWIVQRQLLDGIGGMLSSGLFDDSLRLFFLRLGEEKNFYRRAFAINGQNSFYNILASEIEQLLCARIGEKKRQYEVDVPLLENSVVAKYYAVNIVSFAYGWLTGQRSDAGADEIADACIYLMRHSYLELFGKE